MLATNAGLSEKERRREREKEIQMAKKMNVANGLGAGRAPASNSRGPSFDSQALLLLFGRICRKA